MVRPAKIMIEGDCKRCSAWLITLRERGKGGEEEEEGRKGGNGNGKEEKWRQKGTLF